MFSNYIRAGYPILWIKSHEEHRVLTELTFELSKIKSGDSSESVYASYAWDIHNGIQKMVIKNNNFCLSQSIKIQKDEGEEDSNMNPITPLTWLNNLPQENTILFLKDYHSYLEKEFENSFLIKRVLRNLISSFKAQGKTVVLISADVKIPTELDKEVTVIDYKLPTREVLKKVLQGVCESVEMPYPQRDETPLLNAALGMSTFEAENAFSVSVIEKNTFDAKVIQREKSSVVKKTGLLEVIQSNYTLNDIGGCENLKQWAIDRKECFSPEALQFGIKPPKGVLLVGTQGGGKSLAVKALSVAWDRPLYRLDMGLVFGSLVGDSEHNIKRVLDIAEAAAPCILWIDEFEKALAGNKAGGNGHETTRRVFQILLTWMQEKTADVTVAATANEVNSLPPEILRAGRIDAIFYIDLPDHVQREEIIKIHLRRIKRNPEMFNANMKDLVQACDKFTGSEIEVWIQEALVHAFKEKHTDLQLDDMLATVNSITPIAVLMKDDIDAARQWAKNRGTKNASIIHEEIEAPKEMKQGKRKIQIT